ncbi:hypothetical protein DPMN_065603 [Dreissena polymorpha]|uniref:C2H2-type domain-containing protein n=1 Tax=Dreissena polymorpha TaxID=45954 RepID=A0A9D4BRF0_DREPO|nr:hypothetical protein DPMN_065603 [Dreissena polymorpha]
MESTYKQYNTNIHIIFEQYTRQDDIRLLHTGSSPIEDFQRYHITVLEEANSSAGRTYIHTDGRTRLSIMRPFEHHLKRHRATHHDGPKIHVCTTCGRSFATRHQLTAHERSENSNKEIVTCTTCRKSFNSEKLLKQHEGTHALEKRYRCTCKNRIDYIISR